MDKNSINDIKDGGSYKLTVSQQMLMWLLRTPTAKVNREKFLRKELIRYYPESVVTEAIRTNPFAAGVSKECINTIADQVIRYETARTTIFSFFMGLPGGFLLLLTVPVDLGQYFVFLLRIMQKLAYLYGFADFKLDDDELSDDTLYQVTIFMGVMLGVQAASGVVKSMTKSAASKTAKSLAQKALTKTAVYPIVKKIAAMLGVRMTKQIFANAVAKLIPILGGLITAFLTLVTFAPCAKRLKKALAQTSSNLKQD